MKKWVMGLSVAVCLTAGAVNGFGSSLYVSGAVVAWGDNQNGQCDVPGGLTNVVSVSAGNEHSLALTQDGTVVAWGGNSYDNQTDLPLGLSVVVSIAAGANHSMALKSDGTVVAWGRTWDGQCNVPAGLSNVISIAAGSYHSMALKSDGTVVAWGVNSFGQCDVPPGLTDVISITAGSYHSMALKSDGTVVAWGVNWYGQCDVPAGLSDVVFIAAGGTHSMAMKSDGTVVAWGDNGYGQSDVPDGLYDVIALDGGYSHSLAVAIPHKPRITANPEPAPVRSGQTVKLKVGVYSAIPYVVEWFKVGTAESVGTGLEVVLENVRASDSGDYYAVVENALGPATSAVATIAVNPAPAVAGIYRMTGEPITGSRFKLVSNIYGEQPLQIDWYRGGIVVRSPRDGTLVINPITASDYGTYTLVVSNDFGVTSTVYELAEPQRGTVLGWGASGNERTTTPQGLTDVVQVASGMNHNIALKTNGTVVAWGYNGYGQTDVPEGLSDVVSVAAGGMNSCGVSFAVKSDGSVVGWGQSYEVQTYWDDWMYWDPTYGYTGGWYTYTNGVDLTMIPEDVVDVVSVSVGYYHAIALKSDGTVVTWGDEISGNYNYGQYDVPEGLANVVAVVAGGYHSLALKSDGTVVAWGRNWDGQCDVPAGLSGVVSIAAGLYHSLALKSDGTVVAWGDNWDGQCDVPEGLTDAIAIDAGESHSMALKSDGTVVVWGYDNYGQCDVPEMVGVDEVYGIAAGGYHCQAIVPDRDGDGTFDWLETELGRDPNDPDDGGPLAAAGGRVFSAVSGIPGAFVELRGASGRVYHHTTTDDEGVYAIAGVEPGYYYVKVSAEGYADIWYEQAYHRDVAGTLAVPAGTPVSPVDFWLKRGQSRAYATVTSTPSGASIFVDHVPTEQVTPATVDLGQFAASHTVSLGVRLSGYMQPGSISVWPIEGETQTFHVDLEAVGSETNDVMVVTLPEVNAEVFVDGFDAPLGVTPLQIGSLVAASHSTPYSASAGGLSVPVVASHTLVLRKAGYLQPAPIVFAYARGATMEIAVPVNALGTSSNLNVEVRSTPVGASVYVDHLPTEEVTDVVIDWLDAASHGVTELGVGSWHSASHTIMLRKSGYRSSTALPIPFGTGTTNSIEIAMLQTSDQYPVIRLTGDLDFGDIPADVRIERMLSIHNDGDAALNVSGIDVEFPPPPIPTGLRSAIPWSCPSAVFTGSWQGLIPPGATQEVVVTFQPSEARIYSGEVVVRSDASIDTGRIGCSGTGLMSLPMALDADGRIWEFGGDTNWFPQVLVTHDGVDAAQSGIIGNAQESWMETSVTGPAVLSFWWKVSSEADWDWLEFYIDGDLRGCISGEVDWEQKQFNLAEGAHTLRWCFTKDRVDWDPVGADAAWVDQVMVEVESTPSGIPVSWLGKYGLKTDGSDDDEDYDGDGHTAHQEWEADTNPTNRQSVLRFESAPIPMTGSRYLLRWQSVTTRSYDVERATNLVIENAFQPIATGIPGEEGHTDYEDDTGAQPGPFFYRIGVQAP